MKWPTVRRALGTLTILPPIVAIYTSATAGYSQEPPNKAAEQLLSLLQTEKMVNSEREQLANLEYITIPRRTSDETRKAMALKKADLFEEVFKDFTWETLRPDFIHIYAETFTEEEIKAMIAFYETPAGRKLIEKTPEVQSRITAILQRKGTPMIAEMRKAASDALQASLSEQSAPASDSKAANPTKSESSAVVPQ